MHFVISFAEDMFYLLTIKSVACFIFESIEIIISVDIILLVTCTAVSCFKVHWKWSQRITRLLIQCLESTEYMEIRNALIMLTKISSVFPVTRKSGINLEKRVRCMITIFFIPLPFQDLHLGDGLSPLTLHR